MEHTSIVSSPRLSSRDLGVLAAGAAAGAGIYLLASVLIYRIGFPLDDSWIHLTYARNLAELGEWAFQPGHLSAGSTSPLWTFLLALGFWFHLGPYIWTYLLGELCLLGVAVLAESSVRRLAPSYRPRWPWIGMFFLAEWHLQWAALSGMETLLQGLLMSSVLLMLIVGSRRYLLMGLLVGVSMWIRPDGVTLLGPVLLSIILVERRITDKTSGIAVALLGFAILTLPYLAFNTWLSGTPLPNTFYAKQAEYAVWQSMPFSYRVSVLLVQLLTGPSIVLVPGVIVLGVLAVRRRAWVILSAMAWCGGYLLLYILRLPAYQHGRYLMPAMPIFFLFGLLALVEFRKSSQFGRWHWTVQTGWEMSLVFMTLGFVALGARSYGQDVGLIESEMVATARWVRVHLPPQAVLAAHDIGALGYFDDHPLIDMAGLVSPEVIPFIRDEPRLAAFLDRRGANYLIAFPAFYPVLTGNAQPVFTTRGPFAPEIGEKNMTVYLWNAP